MIREKHRLNVEGDSREGPITEKDLDMAMYCIVLYCIVLYCIVLYCLVSFCIAFRAYSAGTAILHQRQWQATARIIRCSLKTIAPTCVYTFTRALSNSEHFAS